MKKILIVLLLVLPLFFAQEPTETESIELPEDYNTDLTEGEVNEPEPEIELNDESVIVLGDDTFDAFIQANPYVLVKFYAPWCGHCKALAPEYIAAAKKLKEQDPVIPLVKVDATANPKLAQKYEIQGYPTIRFFILGEPIEYQGGRTSEEIVGWIKRKTGPAVTELSTFEQIEEKANVTQVLVVLFGAKSGENFELFEKFAKTIDDVTFAVSEAGKEQYGVKEGDVVMFKHFDERRNDCNCVINEDNLKNFVERNMYPIVAPFDEKLAEKIFGEGIPTIFLFVSDEADAQKKAYEEAKLAATELRGKIFFSISHFADELGQRLGEFIGVTEADCPTVRLIQSLGESGEVKKYNYEGEITADGLKQFYKGFSEKTLQPFYKSEEIPATNNEPVKVVVAKSFNDIVLDETKDVLVEFYAPWCGHCKRLAPIYEELAKKLSTNKNIVLAKMDATANEVEGVVIEGFPTLRLYLANKKSAPLNFDGDRTEEKIYEFLKENASIPWGVDGEPIKTEL